MAQIFFNCIRAGCQLGPPAFCPSWPFPESRAPTCPHFLESSAFYCFRCHVLWGRPVPAFSFPLLPLCAHLPLMIVARIGQPFYRLFFCIPVLVAVFAVQGCPASRLFPPRVFIVHLAVFWHLKTSFRIVLAISKILFAELFFWAAYSLSTT